VQVVGLALVMCTSFAHQNSGLTSLPAARCPALCLVELCTNAPEQYARLLASQVGALYEASCYEDALRASLRQVHLPRPGADAFAWLGRVQSALGDHPQAFKAYRLALLLSPHSREHLRLLTECTQALRVRDPVLVTVSANGDLLETENLASLVNSHATGHPFTNSAPLSSASAASSSTSSSAACVSACSIPSASKVRSTAPVAVAAGVSATVTSLSASADAAVDADSLATTYAFAVPLFSDERGALLLGHARGREHDLLSKSLGTSAIFAMRSDHEGGLTHREEIPWLSVSVCGEGERERKRERERKKARERERKKARERECV
jgi:hypothetical protein